METLKELMARVLHIDAGELTDTASSETIASWDSFNWLMLVSEIEKNFSVQFAMDEVMGIKTYKDIKDALRAKGVTEGIGE